MEKCERFVSLRKSKNKVFFFDNYFFRHIVNDESRLFALNLVKRNQHRQLIDFDNHLDLISNDWRNPNIRNELEMSSF